MRTAMPRNLCAFALVLITAACSSDPNVAKRRYLENGNRYFDKGKYKEAAIMYKNALKKDGKFGEGYYRMALTALKLNQPAAAIPDLRRSVELIPATQKEHTEARIKLTELYLSYMETSGKRPDDVLKDVQETIASLLKADPNSFDGRRLRARLYFTNSQQAFQRKNNDEFQAELNKAIAEFRATNAIKPLDQEVVIYLARSLTLAKQFGEAEKIYRELLDRKKDLVAGYREMYRLAAFQGKIEAAEGILKQAIQNNPKEYDLLIDLARHYYATKRRDEVVKVLQDLKSHAKDYPRAYETAGLFYYSLGDGAEAIKQYEEGIQNDSDKKTRYRKLIIEVMMAQGRKEDARKINDQILADDPKDNDALGLQASMLLDRGEVQNAVNQLQTVVLRAPDNFVAQFNLGRGLLEKGDLEAARQRFQEAIRLRPSYIVARLALGQLQLSRREFDAALKNANEAISFDPVNPAPRLIRTAAHLGLGQYAAARQELNALLQANPANQDALFQFGTLNVVERKFKEAEDAYRKCHDLNPSHSRGLLGLIEAVMAQGQTDRAIQLLQSEIQKYPNRVEFRMALAGVGVRANRLDMAISEYKALLDRLDRKSAGAGEVHFKLAQTHQRAGNLASAIESAQKAKEILPNKSTVINGLALLLDASGRKQEARINYEEALRLESENPIALNNLAFLIANTPGGDIEQALTYAQRAKQKQPNILEISDTLGLIYLKKNLADNAIEIFRDCVTKAPNHPTYRYHLGMALLQKGDKVKAKQELQTALTNKPSSKEEEDGIRDLLSRIG